MQNGRDARPGLVDQKSFGPFVGSCEVTIAGGGGYFSSKSSVARARKTYFRPSLNSSRPTTSIESLEMSSDLFTSLMFSSLTMASLISPSIVPPPTKSGALRCVDILTRLWLELPCCRSLMGGLERTKVLDDKGRTLSDDTGPFDLLIGESAFPLGGMDSPAAAGGGSLQEGKS